MTFSGWNTLIENPPGLALGEDQRLVDVNAVSRDWFSTQEIAFIAGRDFTDQDRKGAPVAIVVNETLVNKYFGGGNALGRSLREIVRPGEAAPDLHIIGIVRDAVYLSLREPVPPTMYRHVPQTEDRRDRAWTWRYGPRFRARRWLRDGLAGHVDAQSRRGAAARRP